jgi:AraC-like DNA-binding protein
VIFKLSTPPPDIVPWVHAGIHLKMEDVDTGYRACRFPALVSGGLTVVVEGAFGLLDQGRFYALPAAFLSGPSATPLTLYRTSRLTCIGLTLKAAALPTLLEGGASLLLNRIAAADEVWNASWRPWAQQLGEALTQADRLNLLFDFVRARFTNDQHRERLQEVMRLQAAAVQDLRGAPDAVGLSYRQFERVFSSTLGMRPKLFQRIFRMEWALRDALASQRTDSDIALRHGYFDQSHMGKDLRLFAGNSLGNLVGSIDDPASEHWPLAIGAAYRRAGIQTRFPGDGQIRR